MLGMPIVVRSRLKVLIMERNLARARVGEQAVTLRDISAATGLALSTVNGLSSNRSKGVDFETLSALCKFFACHPCDLLEYIPDAPEEAAL